MGACARPARWRGPKSTATACRALPRPGRYARRVGRAGVRISRDHRIGCRGGGRRCGITTLAALPDSAPAIDDPGFGAAVARPWGGDGQPHHPALRRGHPRLPGRGVGGDRPAGRGGRGCVHGWSACRWQRTNDAASRCHTRAGSGSGSSSIRRIRASSGSRRCRDRRRELATRLGLPGIPAAAEEILVARDISLARLTGGSVHFAHVSTARALDLIRRAKDEGLNVTCDTAPPYFDLNETAIGEFRTYAKLSPPLRTDSDRLAVAAALRDGTVGCRRLRPSAARCRR